MLAGGMAAPELDPMSSYMNQETYSALCDRPIPRAFVHRLAKRPRCGALVQADTILCRTNCLQQACVEGLPVLCPLDAVRETRGQPVDLSDVGYVFIHKPLDSCPEPNPPRRGSDWYPFPAAKELLDTRGGSFGAAFGAQEGPKEESRGAKTVLEQFRTPEKKPEMCIWDAKRLPKESPRRAEKHY